MTRIIIGAILGAVIIFNWNYVAWMVLPLHNWTLNQVKDEDAFRSLMESQELKAGFYNIPGDMSDMDKFSELHRKGPNAVMVVHAGGEPMPPTTFAFGFALNLMEAFIVAFLLSGATCCRKYLQRVGFVFGIGLFAAIATHVAHWNWMHYPLDFTIGMVADMAIGWTLVGLVMALIIKPRATSPAA